MVVKLLLPLATLRRTGTAASTVTFYALSRVTFGNFDLVVLLWHEQACSQVLMSHVFHITLNFRFPQVKLKHQSGTFL